LEAKVHNSQTIVATPRDLARAACLASLQIRHIRETQEAHTDCVERFLNVITERMRMEKFRAGRNVTLPEIDWVTAHIVTTMFLPELSVGGDREFLCRLLNVIDKRIAAPLGKIVASHGDLSELTDDEIQSIEDICYRVAFKMSEFSNAI
jgi:hypothetical protein